MKLHLEWMAPVPLGDGAQNGLIYDCNLDKLPGTSGIYVFARKYGTRVEALYVGKAIIIRSRIKTQLRNLPLMIHVKTAMSGQRILLVGQFPPVSGKLSGASMMISHFQRAERRDELTYSTERRAAVLKKLEPPNAVPLRQLAKDEGISEATLHTWRRDARSQGRLLPDADAGPDGWTSRDKFAAVLETAALNEVDLATYCRQRGLYAEQIQAWRTACEQANDWARASSQRLGQATKDDKKQIKALERDLARKEKALAEAAALLVLRKNAAAIWGDGEDA